MSDRMRQVNSHLQTRISAIIRAHLDMPLGCFVTISQVLTSRDLKHAEVLVTILPDDQAQSTLKFLQRNAPRIRGLLGKQIAMKFTPALDFVLDAQLLKAQGVYDVLDRRSDADA